VWLGVWGDVWAIETDSNPTFSSTLLGSCRGSRVSDEYGEFQRMNAEQERATFFFGPRD
jgi:hypothetical protein